MSIGVVIPTLNSAAHLRRCLTPIFQSGCVECVLVIDSSSTDGTVELAGELGAETHQIPRRAFNHGATREVARKRAGTDVVVMLTPDAYPLGPTMVERLVEPVVEGRAALAYGRQVARPGADLFEAFAREFNYPASGEACGGGSCFCSNSFAAWSNRALDEVGGFPTVLTAEDQFAARALIQAGYQKVYVPEAVVEHSHSYTLWEEFTRFFDTGLVRRDWAEGDSRRGREYARELLRRARGLEMPYAFLHLAAKWLGYRVGTLSDPMPRWWKRMLGMQSFYWTSEAVV